MGKSKSCDDDDCNEKIIVKGKKAERLTRLLKKSSSIRAKKKEYSTSFSIHGLSRIFHGNVFEKIFWMISLSLAIMISGLLIQKQLKSFIKKETYTDETFKIVVNNTLPTITLCSYTRESTFCGYDIAKYIHTDNEFMLPCSYEEKKTDDPTTFSSGKGVHFKGVPWIWLYCVTDCFDVLEKWAPTPRAPCVQLNKDSKIARKNGRMTLRLRSSHKKNINFLLFLHEGSEKPYFFDEYHEVSFVQNTYIKLSKTLVKKLPQPYSSNCIDEEQGKKLTIFPGKYTIQSCVNTIKCIQALQTCGNTFDFCFPFLPKHLIRKYHKPNQTIYEVYISKCLNQFIDMPGTQLQCPEPCMKMAFEVDWMTSSGRTTMNYAELTLQMKDKTGYVIKEEKPMYSLADLLGIIGGTVGLFCGFSILSLLELLLFFIINLFAGRKSRKETS